MAIYKDSRYKEEQVFVRPHNGSFKDTLTLRLIDRTFDETNAEMHTIIQGEELDLIAFDYYGDPELWSLIADINPSAEPWDLIPGQVIVIPKLEGI